MGSFLISLCFGAGVAAFVYSKMSRRVGYGNTQNIVTIVSVVFILTTVVFYTILAFVI